MIIISITIIISTISKQIITIIIIMIIIDFQLLFCLLWLFSKLCQFHFVNNVSVNSLFIIDIPFPTV